MKRDPKRDIRRLRDSINSMNSRRLLENEKTIAGLRTSLEQMAKAHADRFREYGKTREALKQLLELFYRVQAGRGDWTVADTLKLEEIRKLASYKEF